MIQKCQSSEMLNDCVCWMIFKNDWIPMKQNRPVVHRYWSLLPYRCDSSHEVFWKWIQPKLLSIQCPELLVEAYRWPKYQKVGTYICPLSATYVFDFMHLRYRYGTRLSGVIGKRYRYTVTYYCTKMEPVSNVQGLTWRKLLNLSLIS